mmetsp:Transcript_2291/g.7187  ORF Transcript_2291/g.7187 Transcript_2291/m.7187 type:complete len:217 (-) Transcript_2291:348-998(-)
MNPNSFLRRTTLPNSVIVLAGLATVAEFVGAAGPVAALAADGFPTPGFGVAPRTIPRRFIASYTSWSIRTAFALSSFVTGFCASVNITGCPSSSSELAAPFTGSILHLPNIACCCRPSKSMNESMPSSTRVVAPAIGSASTTPVYLPSIAISRSEGSGVSTFQDADPTPEVCVLPWSSSIFATLTAITLPVAASFCRSNETRCPTFTEPALPCVLK